MQNPIAPSRRGVPVLVWVALLLHAPSTVAVEPVDLDAVTRIRDEGFRRSQVMETLRYLTDRIGPRVTGSPQMKRANEWTRDKLAAWGLARARLEAYEFGRGWSFARAAVHMVQPHQGPLIALPEGWTPGTGGPVRGEVVRVSLKEEKDLEAQRGKLAGKIVFLDEPPALEPDDEPAFERYEAEDLEEIARYPIVADRADWRARARKRWEFREKLRRFLEEEKVLATVEASSRRGGLVRVGGGGSPRPGEPLGVPSLVMTAEHYNWVARLLEEGEKVELELDIETRFHEEDTNAYNTLAEIPGTDKADELVMAGAHLDSWHAGTGATDNAAGCAVMMEALRILRALDVKPRRTIRLALWSGEEQGLLGSEAYVREHFAAWPEPEDAEERALPRYLWRQRGALQLRPDHAKLAAYFNLDNGAGKIRGIYAQDNAAARPIFEAWLEPLRDLGADTVTLRTTGGTDHMSFERVGLPGFQFIQDRLDYFTRTHHTNMDGYDAIVREDLMQAAVVVATFLYHAAMRAQPLPRKPLPRPEEEQEEEEKQPEQNATERLQRHRGETD